MFDREQSPFDPLFTLKEVKAQEETYRFDKFDTGSGILLGKILIELTEETGLPIAFKIKLNGLVIFQYMPEGTGRFNELWLDKKLYTVETMKESTMAVWINAAEMGLKRSFQEMVPSSDLVMCGGGFPIYVNGCGVVGALAVSGPGDQIDHEFAVEALRRFTERQ